jgi:hypothetical protein
MSGPGVTISAIEANVKSESDSIVLEKMITCSMPVLRTKLTRPVVSR